MSLLQSPPAVLSGVPHLDELEQVFRAWADDQTHPDVIPAGPHRGMSMTELAHLLGASDATLSAVTSAGLGLSSSTTIGTASSSLLWATVDPDGPRCRSFRAATFFLRGLVLLDAEPGEDLEDRGSHP